MFNFHVKTSVEHYYIDNISISIVEITIYDFSSKSVSLTLKDHGEVFMTKGTFLVREVREQKNCR